MWALGVEFPFWSDPPAPVALRVPVNVRPIAAYSRVGQLDLINPQNGQFQFLDVPLALLPGRQSVTCVGTDGEEYTGVVSRVVESQEEHYLVVGEQPIALGHSVACWRWEEVQRMAKGGETMEVAA